MAPKPKTKRAVKLVRIRRNRKSQKAVAICAPSGDAAAPPKQILTVAYPIDERCALFKQRYSDSIGISITSRRPGLRLGIDPTILFYTVRRLGFANVDEERESSQSILPENGKLNMLLLTSSKSKLNLSGPNCLVIKPFVGRMYFMCTKWFLVHSMRRIENRMRQDNISFTTGSGRVFNHMEFTPFTLNLNNKKLEDILAAFRFDHRL